MEAGSHSYYADLAAEAEIPAKGIHSQTVSKANGVEVVLFAMAPGEELSEHSAARPAIIHVLRGDGHLTVDGEGRQVSPGSWLRMAARTPHALSADTGLVFALYLLPAADPQS